MKAITPERRTELLANSMQDVGFGFILGLFCLGMPVVSLALGGYLAMGLIGCAAVVEPLAKRWLWVASVCAVAAGALMTVRLFVDVVVSGWVAACLGVGVFAAAHGFACVAAWFGGVQRWQRARGAAVAWLCSISLIVGLGLGQRSPQMSRWSVRMPGGVVASVASAVALAALLYISMAFADLRSRVKAAIAQQAAATSEAVRG